MIFRFFLTACLYNLFLLPHISAQLSTQALAGSLYIDGDVDYVFDPLNSFQIVVGKNMGSHFEWEVRLGTGRTAGINPKSSQIQSEGGYLVEDVYQEIGSSKWHANYLSNYTHIGFGLNKQSQFGLRRLSVFGGIGAGVSFSQVNINLKSIDQFGAVSYYNKSYNEQSSEMAIKNVKNTYDAIYETKLSEGSSINPYIGLQFGVQFEIKNGLYVILNVRRQFSFTDYLDPIAYSTSSELSSDNDHVNMFSFGFKGDIIPVEKVELPKE